MSGYREIFSDKELYIIKIENSSIKIRVIDKYLKKLGYLLSSAQREEIKNNNSIVFAGKWSIELNNNFLFISPYIKTIMPKKYKEACRVAKIPPKIRGYCYSRDINPNMVSQSY